MNINSLKKGRDRIHIVENTKKSSVLPTRRYVKSADYKPLILSVVSPCEGELRLVTVSYAL